jgi:glycosyltransferase involved in cell wall biosynthesis
MISDLYWPEIIGGAETYVQIISEALTRTNEVTVLCMSDQRTGIAYVNGVKVIRIKPSNAYSVFDSAKKPIYHKPLWHLRSLTNWPIYHTVKKILEKEQAKIVHTHNLQTSPLIFHAIRDQGLPHLHTVHDYSLLCPRTTLLHESGTICNNPKIPCHFYKNCKQRLFTATQVVAPSQFIIDKHLEYGFFRNINTQKLPYSVNPSTIEITRDTDFIDILYVGQLSQHKGIRILINAFKQVQRADLRLHICGRGNNEDELRTLAQEDTRIKFHGFLSKKALNHYYSQANVLVVPSIWYDNSPMVIYEAFSHGIPVIGSRIGGIPELVKDSENGFLFESRNEQQLAELLTTLSSSTLNQISHTLLRHKERYGLKDHINKLQALYQNIGDAVR